MKALKTEAEILTEKNREKLIVLFTDVKSVLSILKNNNSPELTSRLKKSTHG